MKAIGYVRVSTEEQAASGLGLEAQRVQIAVAASRFGYSLGAVYADEGLSGALPPHERPALARAVRELVRGEVLLVAKRDRLARDRIEIALLERDLGRRGVRIVSAAGEGTAGTGSSALFERGMADLLAEHERERIRERTREGLERKRARGERAGAVPFGYTADASGKLLEDLEELAALELMRERRAAGLGYRAIARLLEERGYRPKRAARWHPSSVKAILRTDSKRR